VAPRLDQPVGRVMFAVGDHDDRDVLLEGGKPQYSKLLARCGGDEVATYQAAAAALAGFYAAQPVRISGSKAIDYSDRVPTWLAMAKGEIPYPWGRDGSAIVVTPATARQPQIGQLTAGTRAARRLR
jgi:hypothetical protein